MDVKSRTERKAYCAGYNNPSQFDQNKLMASNTPIAQAVIAGITDRAKDTQAGQYKPKSPA